MTHTFDRSAIAADPDRRSLIIDLLEAALRGVDPAAAVARTLRHELGRLVVGDSSLPLPQGRVIVLALGKAAGPMASAAVRALDGIPVLGVAAGPTRIDVPPLVSVTGSHPVPDARSVDAGTALLEAAGTATADDLVLCLISGGGSAIAEAPAPEIPLDDIAAITASLIGSGAPIDDLNTVRRSLSVLKDGGLARAAGEAQVVSLIVSDVVGNPLHVIAGGPTVAGPTSRADAAAVLSRWSIPVPPAVTRHLGGEPESDRHHRSGDLSVVIADGPTAAHAAAARARDHGIDVSVIEDPIEGEARVAGRILADSVPDRPSMLIGWGETTVTVAGSGVGGRNQEVAVGAAQALDRMEGVLVCSFGTDGIDGPTDAAGGLVDEMTLARAGSAGVSASKSLADNDTLRFLEATGDLLRCGATGTNVGDLFIVWRWK